MLRCGFQSVGVLQLCLTIPIVSSLPLIDSWLIFHSLHLARVVRTADSLAPLLQSLCGGDIRSHLYFQDAVCHHWLHCPHITSSFTLRFCRIPFHSIIHQFNALSWGARLDFPHSIHYECGMWLLSWSRTFILASEGFSPANTVNESTSRSNKARGPDGIRPGHLNLHHWLSGGVTISKSKIHGHELLFRSWKSKHDPQFLRYFFLSNPA